MNIGMILEMAASATERPAVVAGSQSLSAAGLLERATVAAERFSQYPAVLYLGTSHLAYPIALFGAAAAGVPFIPLNYRLGSEQLRDLLDRNPGALLLRQEDLDALAAGAPARAPLGSVLPGTPTPDSLALAGPEDDPVAVVLYTSGTTSAPKAALLRHRHLLAYVWNTVEFGSADEGDAALVGVPPYHVAGLANVLTNLYAGRRLVYLAAFDPSAWLATVRAERVSHALLVPTMLARVVAELRERGADDAAVPSLRSLAYGGARMPRPVLEDALRLFPEVGFVNAYGLTETASSIAVLGPDDHRAAISSGDPAAAERLGSVGRAVPGVEFEVRDARDQVLAPGEVGLIFVRGDQVSGEYGGHSALDADGWFPTRDRGWIDAEGYVFIEGRDDDTIIRGGENIAPAEIEDVLLAFPGITEAAVMGVPDPEWGQRLVAVVVWGSSARAADPEQVRDFVRSRLRSSKTPEAIVSRSELPKTDTGKLLRRVLAAELSEGAPA
ncbi:MAG TPA: AMP-binding protein [Trebonia sp.]|nr:AMP-binding protein [Trebonia sp.]